MIGYEASESTKHFSRIKEILCNFKKIETLSKEGGQPFLSILANQLMLITMEEENEINHEQMDFICSFLHKSIYKSLIPENFLDFDEDLQLEYPIFDTKNERVLLLEEIKNLELIKTSKQIISFINGELERNKIRETPLENNFCEIF